MEAQGAMLDRGGSAAVLVVAGVLAVNDILVFTVTPQDVAGTTVTTLQLARQWAPLLAQGLGRALPDSTFHF